jgi:aromatic-L-amino-acid decarboxylase
LLPFGIGGLLVRDPATLVKAHEGQGPYMQDVTQSELPHYLAMGPELSRPNRGLPVWLALHVHGIGQFRETLDRMLDLAALVAGRLDGLPEIELSGRPELSIVAFRAVDGNPMTRHVLAALNGSREVHVSSTTINNHLYARLAFLSQRTTKAIAMRAVDLVGDAVTTPLP